MNGMPMPVPSPLEIARMQFAQFLLGDLGHLFRKDIYGLDIQMDIYSALKQWEEKIEDLE